MGSSLGINTYGGVMEVGLGKGQSGTLVQSHEGLDDPDPTGSSGTELS